MISVKLRVLMALYPLALSTEHVSLRAAFTNSLWTSHNISASMKNIYIQPNRLNSEINVIFCAKIAF